MADQRPAREWNARSYDRLASPLTARGVAVLERAHLSPEARVLDAGCGTGRVSAALLERLPRGQVVALDGSQEMLRQARLLIGDDSRVEFVQADLTRDLPVSPPVDVVVSTSTLHWVPDHPRLLARLASVLKPGGSLHVDCGGSGNIAEILAILAELGEDHPWTFSGPEETEASLVAAGFAEARVWMSTDPVELSSRAELHEYLGTVILGTHLASRTAEEGEDLVQEVASRMSGPRVDYVRLNIDAWLG